MAHCLHLKKSARMLTLNTDLSDHLVGTVDNIIFTEPGISKVYLKFDDPSVGKQLMCSNFYSNTHQAVPIRRPESHISLIKKNNLHMLSRTQFSLILAHTCTIHKVQDLTLPNTVVVLDSKK